MNKTALISFNATFNAKDTTLDALTIESSLRKFILRMNVRDPAQVLNLTSNIAGTVKLLSINRANPTTQTTKTVTKPQNYASIEIRDAFKFLIDAKDIQLILNLYPSISASDQLIIKSFFQDVYFRVS